MDFNQGDDDFFGDDSYLEANITKNQKEMAIRTQDKISRKLYNEGYSQGKADEESEQMQRGFDRGFHFGIVIGKISGALLAARNLHNKNSSANSAYNSPAYSDTGNKIADSTLPNPSTAELKLREETLEENERFNSLIYVKIPEQLYEKTEEILEELVYFASKYATHLLDGIEIVRSKLLEVDKT